MASDEPPAKRARLASLPAEAARTQQACTACRERKIKCCGNQPCRYCSKRGLECAFVEVGRKKMYPVAYVEELERKASGNISRNAESSSNITHADVSQTAVPSINDIPNIDSDSSTSRTFNGLFQRYEAEPPTMSSSLDFGTRIRDLTRDSQTPNLRGGPILSHETPDNVYDIEPESTTRRQSRFRPIQWPNEEEAHGLLNSVTSSIGSVQHLIDPRTFSDTLSHFYDSDSAQLENIELHHVEMLMVFSLGGLLQGKIKSGSSFPGAEYFLEAVNNLPSLCALRKAGSLAIEIMGLFAFFLQCSDRKDDAYIYAGLALRLAVSNGLARGHGGQRMKRSESVHRNRLWWTIYMQERRLAAATGNPVGILDENITAPLPTESAGFPPVAALNINIKLAKMTGRILQNIYSARHRSERQFLRTIHDLVTELNNLHKDTPPSCKVDVSQPGSVTRTSATLSLMFSQAVILTTRPILLHLAKSGLGGNNTDGALTGMSRSQKLANACIEAAGVSLDVLHLLRQQALLGKLSPQHRVTRSRSFA
ncbi:hypothetical protein FB567DRAFT_446872 [Paraphoma chrysanthemicola]|uniref:Zn(2)-C6 fungal-type domain-containing protein n=1 Tax=Paraphoma chrysanthemicola TaxID=798071 RepID=A0A8K0R2S3_9PLEO|nr:hypothetical protein FB567DRAFT_446872 [Paraphoma chrysanthemicola]